MHPPQTSLIKPRMKVCFLHKVLEGIEYPVNEVHYRFRFRGFSADQLVQGPIEGDERIDRRSAEEAGTRENRGRVLRCTQPNPFSQPIA